MVGHDAAVRRLRESYANVPADQPVRLAKRTSNVFRPRLTPTTRGLDVSGLDGVLSVDPVARTADVQGMCTYERLVAATLVHGLAPYVVPQLRTITIGGAVTGLGIEAASFRNGLPHESVLEMDVLTGGGDLVTARPGGEHADLFAAFPNSYGTLGYATRLRIELEPVRPYVGLRHVPFDDLDALATAVEKVVGDRTWDGEPVDYLDGVAFAPDEACLSLGRYLDDAGEIPPSDYTGEQVYYRSLRSRPADVLTVEDYLWRWDTDWFWCSAAFGAQRPAVRRLWPARWRRSDVYHRIVGLENRYRLKAGYDRWRGRPARERVVQDVELPLDRTAEFLRWFDARVGMRPVWLCPLRLREREWPLYPLRLDQTYVNVGFWGTVPIAPGAVDGDVNRDIEATVTAYGGHKSLYSDVYYDRDAFDDLYGGPAWRAARRRYDPAGRLTGRYDKVVGRR